MRLICAFALWSHKPVPWSVGTIFRHGQKKAPRLVQWQSVVHKAAREAMARQGTTTEFGPIHIDVRFFVEIKPNKQGYVAGDPAWVAPGKTESGHPNLSNLFKGVEDAMQGGPYANDMQVCSYRPTQRYGTRAGMKIAVFAIEPEDSMIEDAFDGCLTAGTTSATGPG